MSDRKRRWWQRKVDDRRLIGPFDGPEVAAIQALAARRGVDVVTAVNQAVKEVGG